ncbi:MAG: sodium:solute symporter family protein [Opitutaceae bacterium]|nr:sodium:solute symporter family protein [Opitutaceae bacterium]
MSAEATDTAGGGAFTALDWTVLLGYFAGITLFGLWLSRRVQSSGDYFLGDRKLPWWIMVGQSFGTGTNAENPVAQTGASCQAGFSTIWYQWKNMLITPFYWLMAPWYRRSGRTTIGEIIEDRYGRAMALLYTVFALAFFVFNQGAMLKGGAKIIAVATGGDMISPNGVVVAMTVAFIVYSFFGGLIASAYTDFVQGLLIILLSFLLIPPGLRAVGGLSGLRETLPPEFFQLYSEASGVGLFAIAMLALNGVVGITAMPHSLAMNATGRTERAGRIGQTYGSLVKRFCTIGWAFTGLIVAALLVRNGDHLPDMEHAFGYASLHLLGPGLVGLMVACVLAANMSTCSNFMVNTGALFTNNLYKTYLRPNASDRDLLWVGRVSGLGLTLAGVGFALMVDQVLQAFLFTETIAALMGIMFLGGFLWPRANRHGALAATLASFAVYFGFNVLRTGRVQLVYKWEADVFGAAMLAGAGAFVVVSLLTPPENPARMDAFFARLRRSSDGDEAEGGPPAALRGQDLLMLDAPGWFRRERWRGFWSRYREDCAGFGLAWVTAGLLVALAWAVTRLG